MSISNNSHTHVHNVNTNTTKNTVKSSSDIITRVAHV